MAYKSNIPKASRDLYFTPAGDSTYSGLSQENPLSTPAEAIAKVNALSPPVDAFNPASINASQTGTFNNTGITLPQYTAVNGGDSGLILTADSQTCATLATGVNFEWGALLNQGSNGVCLDIDGSSRIRTDISTQVVGPFFGGPNTGGVATRIEGIVDDLFLNSSIMELRNTGAVGYDYIASNITRPTIDQKVIEMFANDCVAFSFNPPNATDKAVFVCDNIEEDVTVAPTGCIGLKVSKGELTAQIANIQAETAVYVDGGECSLDCTDMKGDIMVTAGSELNINVIHFEGGNIINAGILNGNIGGTRYGSYIEGVDHFTSWFRPGAIPSSWDTFGSITLDAAVYDIDDVEASFNKTNAGSKTADFQLINATTLDVYFTGSLTTTATGKLAVTMAASVAFPSTGTVILDMQVKRTGGAAGMQDAASTLQFSER